MSSMCTSSMNSTWGGVVGVVGGGGCVFPPPPLPLSSLRLPFGVSPPPWTLVSALTPGMTSALPSSRHSATLALICSRTSVLISPVSPIKEGGEEMWGGVLHGGGGGRPGETRGGDLGRGLGWGEVLRGVWDGGEVGRVPYGGVGWGKPHRGEGIWGGGCPIEEGGLGWGQPHRGGGEGVWGRGSPMEGGRFGVGAAPWRG